ncbi:MAG: hypothetical protein ABRQ26_10525 [Syntrophomonadaceae bacterium]
MKLSKREMVLLTILLIAASIFIYYNYIYMPVAKSAAAVSSENEKISANLRELEKLKANQKKPAQVAQKLKTDYQALLTKVPEDPYVPEMIVYLADAAKESRVELKKIDYKYDEKSTANTPVSTEGAQDKKTANAAAVKSSQLEVEATGTYYDILTFMLKVENAPRAFVLTGLDMTSSKRKPQDTATVVPASGTMAQGTSGSPTTPSTPVPEQALVGSAAYDGNSILLKLKFQSFFDQVTADNMKGVDDPVAPSIEGKNPFS